MTEDALGKVELGVKLTCESCGARFYDLNKTPAKCPKCGAANSRPVVFKARRPSPMPEDKRPAPAKNPEDVADDDVVADVEDDEDEAVIEDTSDLGEDDSDVEVVVDNDN
jgi:uncharacterized protein (TIGR02300 family)